MIVCNHLVPCISVIEWSFPHEFALLLSTVNVTPISMENMVTSLSLCTADLVRLFATLDKINVIKNKRFPDQILFSNHSITCMDCVHCLILYCFSSSLWIIRSWLLLLSFVISCSLAHLSQSVSIAIYYSLTQIITINVQILNLKNNDKNKFEYE